MCKRIVNICVVLLLLALFTIPSHFLTTLSDELTEQAELAADAVLRDDFEDGLTRVQNMNAEFRLKKSSMHFFLSHQIVEEIDFALRSCLQLMLVEDKPQTLLELEQIITLSRYMKTIEKFSWPTLL